MPNTPEEVLAKLWLFLSHAYRIYEAVVPEATFEEFVAKGEQEIEGCHHSSAVRIRVRRALRQKPPDLNFTVMPLANNGIEVLYLGHTIKFYKGVNGHPPPCGDSEAKRDFYQQSFLDGDDELHARKLVVICNVAKDGTFLGLDLACPKGVVTDYTPPECYWSIPIPHPATGLRVETPYEGPADDLDIKRPEDKEKDEDDLDIRRKGTNDKE
jgi:hypothetical protein